MAFNKQSSSSPSSANETANDSSEAAGPIAGRRETLAARAQRFIGKVLETEPTSTSDSCTLENLSLLLSISGSKLIKI